MDKYINAPISDEDAKSLHSGDYVYITGTIYTCLVNTTDADDD